MVSRDNKRGMLVCGKLIHIRPGGDHTAGGIDIIIFDGFVKRQLYIGIHRRGTEVNQVQLTNSAHLAYRIPKHMKMQITELI